MARLTCRLLGTGSSGGVPRVGGDWGACDPTEPKNRRMRCSALLTLVSGDASGGATQVLVDTSPDLREQLLEARITALDGVVFTHDHADQTHGIDDIRPLVIASRSPIPAFLDVATAQTLVPKFRYVFEGAGGYPAILDRQTDIEAYKAFQVKGAGGVLDILPLDQAHGRIRSLGFRVGALAYCNDLNDLPERSIAELEGLEVLIIDALRYKPHPSHAHLDLVLEWVRMLEPKRTVLTNLHVDLDYQTLRNELPEGVEAGYDGLEISVDIDN